MTIYQMYNYPMGQVDLLFTAHIGALTVNEAENTFQLGISPQETPNMVRWISEHPVDAEMAESEEYRAVGRRGDRIIVEARNGEVVIKRIILDTGEHWPAHASGGTSVSASTIYP